ncbi:MAG: serine/threonine-protein kinase [Candidatus Riflebacteria bacterium]|nr:serine/threonine-protein kinase [Candidatus Riflebacteria bacterium]
MDSSSKTLPDSQIKDASGPSCETVSDKQSDPQQIGQPISSSASFITGKISSFRTWNVVESFPAKGGEADIFLIEKNNQFRILKLFRTGIHCDHLTIKRILSASTKNPSLFVKIIEYGNDPEYSRDFEMQEYLNLGTLDQTLKKKRFKSADLMTFFDQIIKFLNIIHSEGIIHLDLKPSNIMLRAHSPLKVAFGDFGSASIIEDEFSKKMTDFRATGIYQSPESLAGIFSRKSDWWSTGIIIYEMISGKSPFDNLTEHEALYTLSTKDVPIPFNFKPEIRTLLAGLLTRNPELRWGYDQVFSWYNTISPSALDSEVNLDAGTTSSGNEPAWKIKPPPIFIIAGKDHQTIQTYLKQAAISIDNWTEACEHVRTGLTVKWVESQRNAELAEEVYRIFGKTDNPDLVVFLMLMRFTPSSPLYWRGNIFNEDLLKHLLLLCVTEKADANDLFMIEMIFSGDLSSVFRKFNYRCTSEVDKIVKLSESIRKFNPASLAAASQPLQASSTSTIGSLSSVPLNRHALVILAVTEKLFAKFGKEKFTDEAFSNLFDSEVPFRIAFMPGFLEWAASEKLLSEAELILWRFMLEFSKNISMTMINKRYLDIISIEEKMVYALKTDSKFQNEFILFLNGSEPGESVVNFIASLKSPPEWIIEIFNKYFSIKSSEESANIFMKFHSFIRLRNRESVFRNHITPPDISSGIDNLSRLNSDVKYLKFFLSKGSLDKLSNTVQHPETLPLKSENQFKNWNELIDFLELPSYVFDRNPDDTKIKTILRMLNFRSMYMKKASLFSMFENIQFLWAFAGAAFSGYLISTGLAVVPALLIFLIVLFQANQECKSEMKQISFELSQLKGKFVNSGEIRKSEVAAE